MLRHCNFVYSIVGPYCTWRCYSRPAVRKSEKDTYTYEYTYEYKKILCVSAVHAVINNSVSAQKQLLLWITIILDDLFVFQSGDPGIVGLLSPRISGLKVWPGFGIPGLQFLNTWQPVNFVLCYRVTEILVSWTLVSHCWCCLSCCLMLLSLDWAVSVTRWPFSCKNQLNPFSGWT